MKKSKEDSSFKSIPFRCLPDLLAYQARRVADDVGVFAPERMPLTYPSSRHHKEWVVSHLYDLGVGCSERVVFVLPIGPEIVSPFPAEATDATAAPLNLACRRSEFDFYPGDRKARTLVVQAGDELSAHKA